MSRIEEIDIRYNQRNVNSIKYTNTPEFTKLSFRWDNMLDSPPQNDSLETISELNYLVKITSVSSVERKNIIFEVDKEPKTLFYKILKSRSLSFPEKEFDQFYNMVQPAILNIKNHFNRPRPYQLAQAYNKKINVIETKTIHTPSYPSGHSVYGMLCFLFCREYYPYLSLEFRNAVELISNCREYQGVHYKSDTAAGILLGSILYERLR